MSTVSPSSDRNRILQRWKHHLLHERGLSNHSVRAYFGDVRQFMETLPTNIEINAVSRLHVRSWIGLVVQGHFGRAVGAKSATINRKRSSLKAFYEWAIRQGLASSNPTDRIQPAKRPKRLPRYLSIENSSEIIENPSQSGTFSVRNRALLELLYGGGLRVSEAASLDRDSIDLAAGTVTVLGKGRKIRTVPIGQMAVTAVQELLSIQQIKPNEPLFRNRFGNRLSTRSIWQICRDSGLQNGQSNVHPHLFRHSCATHLLASGADLRVIQEQLGHASLGATQHYAHINIEHLRALQEELHPLENGPKPTESESDSTG